MWPLLLQLACLDFGICFALAVAPTSCFFSGVPLACYTGLSRPAACGLATSPLTTAPGCVTRRQQHLGQPLAQRYNQPLARLTQRACSATTALQAVRAPTALHTTQAVHAYYRLVPHCTRFPLGLQPSCCSQSNSDELIITLP